MIDLPLIEPDTMRHICANLRKADREEIAAVAPSMDPDDLVERYMPLRNFAWSVSHDGVPAAVIGAWPVAPCHWKVFAFGTDDFESVALTLTKHVRRFMIPAIVNADAIKADCESLSTHHKAHRWLESLGYERTENLPGFGQNGEDFVRFTTWRTNYVR